jgi:hypothetical protein
MLTVFSKLASSIAEDLKRLSMLEFSTLQATMVELQQLLPPRIRVYQAGGDFQINIVPTRNPDPMSLENILHALSWQDEVDPPALDREDSDIPESCPGTPGDYESYIDAMPACNEEYLWDNFDVVDWPTWVDDELP